MVVGGGAGGKRERRRSGVRGHGRLAIFLSHANQDAALVRETAAGLSTLGIHGFVATHDVTPAEEWLPQLEEELIRAQVLAAFLSPAFRESSWTDQEIGYALGQRHKIIPVQLTQVLLPHGFLQRYQSLAVMGMDGVQIAEAMFELLLENSDTQPYLRDNVIQRVMSERSETALWKWLDRAGRIRELTQEECEQLRRVIETNPVIRNSRPLKAEIEKLMNGESADGGSVQP